MGADHAEMAGGLLYAEHVGVHEMVGIHTEAEDAAAEELDKVAALLVETGEPLGMTGARILVWEDCQIRGEPAVVREATADQLAIDRLRLVTREVE
ncbi:hypothetical protein NQK81_02195 [Amycolatopsis roodepoortensis]|uniref:hypothetical protein n=1 Tax=Amycolatopsis roodepoortensis TaxID=700274 RepID=UPI00214B9F5E|nr:hypothetical protein [Amycolatopsis roodepoortensis]UUV32285.1 hypothetical protein NQK81_02195 [Amycolatopsis roodepoortensis]